MKARRKEAALTQDVAAMLCGVTNKTLIRVEMAEDVSISTVFKILHGLGSVCWRSPSPMLIRPGGTGYGGTGYEPISKPCLGYASW
ncbi:helix-turn-helix domain-containing protein [Shewanella chilikensis]|uniref:helix-turn-helix domain-containing protein n=1 Tax=Shewanella chilikensis TaxID=558541 RepID=UPI001F1BEAAE|nr:helix-turn-helix transcriptional regulator [Shewanella chilikensis]MCE9786313.1 helix-turn-helix domain-containing protein [Shewanella chilikensis]